MEKKLFIGEKINPAVFEEIVLSSFAQRKSDAYKRLFMNIEFPSETKAEELRTLYHLALSEEGSNTYADSFIKLSEVEKTLKEYAEGWIVWIQKKLNKKSCGRDFKNEPGSNAANLISKIQQLKRDVEAKLDSLMESTFRKNDELIKKDIEFLDTAGDWFKDTEHAGKVPNTIGALLTNINKDTDLCSPLNEFSELKNFGNDLRTEKKRAFFFWTNDEVQQVTIAGVAALKNSWSTARVGYNYESVLQETRDVLGYVKTGFGENYSQIYPPYLKNTPSNLEKLIQGSSAKEYVEQLIYNFVPPEEIAEIGQNDLRIYRRSLKDWIRTDATPQQVEKFVKLATGFSVVSIRRVVNGKIVVYVPEYDEDLEDGQDIVKFDPRKGQLTLITNGDPVNGGHSMPSRLLYPIWSSVIGVE